MSPPKKPVKGGLKAFIAKHLDININYAERGAIKQEAERLLAKAKAEGLSSTSGSMSVALGHVVRELGKGPSAASHAPRGRSAARTPEKGAPQDDFALLDSLCIDAIAAIKLVQEQAAKVRRETERMRAAREKMRKLFE